jgi:stage II sporulation protein AA (anti-sigma F factor antagonist)
MEMVSGRVLVVTLAGELDHHTAERTRAQVDGAFEKSTCRHLVFDMSGVDFMDSSGIGMFIGRYKKAEQRGGCVALAGMGARIEKLFDLSGLAKIVKKGASVPDALTMLGEGVK